MADSDEAVVETDVDAISEEGLRNVEVHSNPLHSKSQVEYEVEIEEVRVEFT